MKSVSEIRREFLEFFAARSHEVVASGPVFPKDDPTLLFTNAGMNQFKDVFLGTGTRSYRRAADTQKCIRAGGKHNDLDVVGYDTYHHTFFEMLGNWSFGDYYKEDAIRWAWELLTEVWALDKSRLYVTVFSGDDADGLAPDNEAAALWARVTDIEPSHILGFGKKENFWEMGDTGPCGPCSEIHYDFTPDRSGAPLVNADDPKVIEIWNLVFMEFERQQGGSLVPLPLKHVDTGMGLERVTAILQGVSSNYDTDIFSPLIVAIAELTGVAYDDGFEGRRHRAVADHVRALAFSIADGAKIDNKGRGYVLKRILRRAARFLRELGMAEASLYKMVPVLVAQMGEAFPELGARQEHIMATIRAEEALFLNTLEQGLGKFHKVVATLEETGSKVIPGQAAWDLHQTYGFFLDLTEQMARERGLEVDIAAFELKRQQEQQKGRSTQAFSGAHLARYADVAATEFIGYQTASADAVRVLRADAEELVIDRSPFYPEGGGPRGDHGSIVSEEPGGFEFTVTDTQKLGDVIVHRGRFIEGSPEGALTTACAQVDRGYRQAIKRNHTSTHLLHWALRTVLGDQAVQQGSVIKPEGFSFDFTHPTRVEADELAEIERMINERIMENAPVVAEEMSFTEAKARGALALFGEKYSSQVRLVTIGDGFSTELCGGIHCDSTGEIGSLTIVRESNVAANVRRLEIVSGGFAVERAITCFQILGELSREFKAPPEELLGKLRELSVQNRELKKTIRQEKLAAVSPKELLARAVDCDGVRLLVMELGGGDAEVLRKLGDSVKRQSDPTAALLFAPNPKGVAVLAACSKALVERSWSAKDMVRATTKILGGGGGGREDLAQGMGKDPSKLSAALEFMKSELEGKARSQAT